MEAKNNPVSNPDFIEPGPFQLAQHGVCYIGEWLRLKPACSYFIRKSMQIAIQYYFIRYSTVYSLFSV